VADWKLMPAGSASCTVTPVARSGPLLPSVTVYAMVSPRLGVGLLTDLPTCTSACCGVSVALAVLLPGLGSSWSARVMAAVFVAALWLTTRTWRPRVA
jgi:hypothetical protein